MPGKMWMRAGSGGVGDEDSPEIKKKKLEAARAAAAAAEAAANEWSPRSMPGGADAGGLEKASGAFDQIWLKPGSWFFEGEFFCCFFRR
jgi:hypothetical protein